MLVRAWRVLSKMVLQVSCLCSSCQGRLDYFAEKAISFKYLSHQTWSMPSFIFLIDILPQKHIVSSFIWYSYAKSICMWKSTWSNYCMSFLTRFKLCTLFHQCQKDCFRMLTNVLPLFSPDTAVYPLVAVQLYSPDRPLVDTAEVFLWLMAVCTILCASYWSAWSAREASTEHEKLLKVLIYWEGYFVGLIALWLEECPFISHRWNNSQDAPEELLKMETSGSGVVDINTASALLFVVIASCFLILLYKRMSSWFVELLVILFCIGGVEVRYITFVFLWLHRSSVHYNNNT